VVIGSIVSSAVALPEGSVALRLPRLACSTPRPGLRPATIAAAGACLALVSASAEQIELTTIGDRPVVAIELEHDDVAVPSWAVLDLGSRGAVLVHTRTAAAIGVFGQGTASVSFDEQGVVWPSVTAVAVELEPLEAFTAEHAEALNEVPAAVVIGLPAFDRVIDLDLGTGRVRHGEAALGAMAEAAASDGASGVIDFEAEAYGYWLTATGPGDRPLRVRLTTGEAFTRIDADLAAAMGHPGGGLPRVAVGGVNLADYVAMRPTDFSDMPDPRPDVSLGADLLSQMRLVIDTVEQRLVLVPQGEPSVSPAVRAFYAARARADADAIEAFLNADPPAEHVEPAVEALVAMRLDERPLDPAASRRAFELAARHERADRRAMALVRLADIAITLDGEDARAYRVAEQALELAEASARDDLDGVATHHINARHGLIALLERRHDDARRALISARFGLPRDNFVNLWLGRLYEMTDQPLRAWTRYAQSATGDEPPIGAIRGLARVSDAPAFRARYPAEALRRLMEGELDVVVQRPASAEGLADHAAPLVELFIDADDPESAQAMRAWAGMSRMFPGFTTAAHHVMDPLANDASARRTARLAPVGLPAVAVDGRLIDTPRGVRGEAWLESVMASIAATLRSASGPAPTHASAPAAVPSVDAYARDGRVIAEIARPLDTPDAMTGGSLQAWLIERVVYWPSPVGQHFHDRVVRADVEFALDDPRRSEVADGPITATFDLATLAEQAGQRLSLIERLSGEASAYRPTRIDPSQCEVLVVRRAADGSPIGWVRAEVRSGEPAQALGGDRR
jgi:hypothetical protein